MRLATERRKKTPKWLKFAGIGAGGVVVIAVIATIAGNLNKSLNFYRELDTFVQVQECNFRYVLDVRCSPHKENNVVNIDDMLNDAGDMAVQEPQNGNVGYNNIGGLDNVDLSDDEDGNKGSGSQTGNLYGDRINVEWGTVDGSKVVNWDYPNYELIITGRTEKLEPLQGAFNVKAVTEYTSADLCNVVYIDDKCYVDVGTLRNWLLTSGDSNLVAVAAKLPDGVTYVEFSDEDELHFITPYAEENETTFSGVKGLVPLYERFATIENLLSMAMQDGMGETGMSTDDSKCRLSLSGEDAVTLVKTISAMFRQAPTYYTNYINALNEAESLSEDEIQQMLNEKDNFILSIADMNARLNAMNTTAIQAMNVQVVGKSNKYQSGSGGTVLEISLGTSYTWDNKDYIVTLQGSKSALSVAGSVSTDKPSDTISPYAAVSTGGYDFGYVKDYLLYYFRFKSDSRAQGKDITWETLKANMLSDFVELVNATNAGLSGGVVTQDLYSIEAYIDRFSNMTEGEASGNEALKANYELVQKFCEVMGYAMAEPETEPVTEPMTDPIVSDPVVPDESEQGEPATEPHELNEFEKLMANGGQTNSFMQSNGTIELVGVKNPDVTRSGMRCYSVKLVNKTDSPVTCDLSKWYVLDKDGNKTPCNYMAQLKDMDSNFASSITLDTEITLSDDAFFTRLYIVTSKTEPLTLYVDDKEFCTLND